MDLTLNIGMDLAWMLDFVMQQFLSLFGVLLIRWRVYDPWRGGRPGRDRYCAAEGMFCMVRTERDIGVLSIRTRLKD